MSDTVRLTCRRCGNEWDKEIAEDELIGPHSQVKKGIGLGKHDPDTTVTRRRGYGTMPAVVCSVCGGEKHDIQVMYT